MNSKNSKTSDSHRLLHNLIEKINSRRSDNCLLYQIIYTWKTPCIRLETVNRTTWLYCLYSAFTRHIAFTQLCSDMVIFSNSTKKVILIELTCPCEENMEKWHDKKLSKYLPLKTTIESNGWSIHLFAVKVVARGFCARSVMCCFHVLGLHNSLVKSTIKALNRLSVESSFCIWVNRNNRDWKSRDHPVPTAKISEPGNITPLPKSKKTEPTSSSARNKSCKPVGFINKGNTCYANSILQALSTVPILQSRLPSESSITSPISKATALNMSIQKRALKPINPSSFLWALKHKISDIRNVSFDFNSQPDSVEVL